MRVADYGNKIAQGQKTNMYYGNLQVGYLLNPKNNLRLQSGFTLRRESGQQQSWFTFGLSSSFRNFYRDRSEEHTSELPSLMRISYDVFCLKKQKQQQHRHRRT